MKKLLVRLFLSFFKLLHMIRTAFILCILQLIFFNVHAQSLYMPREVKLAFDKQTRSPDGQPGKNYWQNRGRYQITIKATPPNRTIYGREKITYINNSPDELQNLLFKLIVNIHKPGAPRLSGVTEDYLTSGVHIDSFTVNGQSQKWNSNPNYFTTVPVRLARPLAANDSLQLSIQWHYDVSLKSNREGMIDSTTFFLAYFYPRVAVYDDYQGWDATAFNDVLEFYNDFNDYELNVLVPKNYLVWATGTLQNPDEVLQPSVAVRYKQSLLSDDVIHLADKQELAAKNITVQNDLNTWKFTAKNITDVALGLSDHFIWDASSAVVDNSTGRRASVQAAYNDTAADFHYMVGFARHALQWLSNKWPGIPYPYPKTTIFQGYAGMEYPMMANDETYDDTAFSKFVAEHEIAHTYMPFYMGINETRFGFMDEGWATTFELLMNRDAMGNEKAENLYKQFRISGWAHDPLANEDLPIITPGPSLSGGGIGNNQYGKPSLGYLAVKEMLGDELFKKCLHAYMNRWNGKHPIPWDFFNTFNDVSGKKLNWFWHNWFFTNGYIDLSIRQLQKTKTGFMVSVANIGGYASPFDMVIHYSDGTTDTIHQTAALWEKNQKMAQLTVNTKKSVETISLEGGIYMDADMTNNSWPKKAY
jgi:hypothetical protein